jgi:hypothetical protein
LFVLRVLQFWTKREVIAGEMERVLGHVLLQVNE